MAWLQELAGAALRVPAPRVPADRPLSELGLDSLAAVELAHAVATQLGLELGMARLLEGPSLAEVAAELWERREEMPERSGKGPSQPGREDLPVDRGAGGAFSRVADGRSGGTNPGVDVGAELVSARVGEHETAADFALTYGQRALWFLDRLSPGNTAYVIGGAARVVGELDAEALVRALHRLGERHPALRSTFHSGESAPVQRVHEVPAVEVVEEDGSGWSAGEVHERLRAAAFRPFDLETGPLLRLVLVRNAPEPTRAALAGSAGFQPATSQASKKEPAGCRRSQQELLVALALHHIVADFWSLGVVVRELGALYAQETGWDAALPPAPAEGALAALADVTRREAERLSGPAGERLWEHWRGAISAFPQVLDLPADRPRPAVQTHGGAARHLRLDGETLAGVGALARGRGATPYMALLAGFAALLARLSGQERLLVGSPTAGRGTRETELVGYFVNPLPIACDVTGEPSFGELVTRLRGRVLAAFAHQELPFPLLAERLAPERDPSRPPVFQVMFVLQKERPGEAGLGGFAAGAESRLRLGGLELASLALVPAGSPFDLSLTLAEVDGGLAGRLVYNPDLFDAATVGRLAGHFSALVSGAVAAPEEPVWRLPLLAAAERHQLVVEWNEGRPLATGSDWIAELWGGAVARDPGAVAVVGDEAVWSRAELEARSNRLAHRLIELGAGPERLVGVLLERSFDLVAGLLAVLKTGAGYLPLDPELPDERIGALLREAGPVALLTGSAFLARAERTAGAVIDLDSEDLSGWSAAPPAAAQEPESVAYVLFTSGSTGTPKGVAVSRRSLENLVRLRAADFGTAYWALHKASIGFDVSVIELFAPLAAGGRIILARPGGQGDLGYLVRLMADQGAATAGFPPAVLAELLEQEGLERCTALRRLASGMDVLPPDLPGRFSARLPACELFNCYGPTEATVYVLEHLCHAAEAGPRVALGRPVGGAEVHLLGGRLEPVPVGAAGELCIGGVGLARGYLGRPELTAERFVPHPWGSPGARLYRTGDLARRRADGAVEFLGRLDRQVKVRGFRVEPGEVEAVLAAHPAVAEAAVVVREGALRSRDLVAFVVPRAATGASAAELGTYLASRLPAYMVPAAFEPLAALPRSAVGKVDRLELDRRAAGLTFAGAEYEAPRTVTEELLAGIWSELLGVERVGRQDGFFSLGGHSLLAARLVSRVCRAFGVELALRAVFEAARLGEMAAAVEAALRVDGETADRPIPALPRAAAGPVELPASFAQERLWFLARLDPGPTYNLPALLRLRGDLEAAALAAALAGAERRHEALRTVLAERRDGLVQVIQVIADEPPGSLPTVDLAGLPGAVGEDELRRLASAEARRPFDLAEGPLLRTVLVRLAEVRGAADHALLLTLHHAVADGWSVGVLARELGVLYRAARQREPAALPVLPVQYGDYAAWQRRRLAAGRRADGAGVDDDSGALAPSLAWWRKRLSGAPAVLDLPSDRPRPPVRSLRGAAVRVALPADLTGRVIALGRRLGATPFMTVLAGFATLLARCGAGGDLPIGAPVSGRTRAEVEGTVGLFVNTLVLRLACAGEDSFAGLLAGVREVVLGAHAHQDVPFDRLVQEMAPERDLSRNPLFQVMLAWEGFSPGAAGARLDDGLVAEILPVDTGIAKLDLTLALGEKAGPAGATLAGFLEINRDLFDPATAVRLAESLAVLLDAAATDPRRRVDELPLLPAGARHQLLVEGNDGSVAPAAPEIGFHDLFFRQAARQPAAVALVDERETVSYADLARRARQVAGRLARLGVQPEVRVGLCAGRSAAAVAGVLGILATGGVYVPLDPAYPAERLAFLIGDAGLDLILVEEALLPLVAALPGAAGARAVPLEELAVEDRATGRQRAVTPVAPPSDQLPPSLLESLAYVIYTSGSTGTPKGVGVTHRTAASLGPAFAAVLGLGPGDRILQFAPGPSTPRSQSWPRPGPRVPPSTSLPANRCCPASRSPSCCASAASRR